MTQFHEELFGLIEKFLEIEAGVVGLTDDSDLNTGVKEFRRKLSELPEELFKLELAVNALNEEIEQEKEGIQSNRRNVSGCDLIWHLGMNLNPADGHYMDYLTGWHSGGAIGREDKALAMDFLDRQVWKEPVDYLAIVRHQHGVVDAVKVFQFKHWGLSMLERFKDMNPGRVIASEGGPIQVSVDTNAPNLEDDPIFSVDGDLALNWWGNYRASRIMLTGGFTKGDLLTYHGLGNHMNCNCHSGSARDNNYRFEVSNKQKCPFSSCSKPVIQGTDFGSTSYFQTGPVYGNYALYVSLRADSFPEPGTELTPTIEVC